MGPARSGYSIALACLCLSTLHAQEQRSGLADLAVGLGALATIDYVGYNLSKDEPGSLAFYRCMQVGVHGAITYWIYDRNGLADALNFNIIWWTFGADLLYYAIAETTNGFGIRGWEGRGTFARAVWNNGVAHARWTPVGIWGRYKNGERIPRDAILIQAAAGLGLALTLTITL